MDLTLDQIRVLDAIDRLGTFAHAAAELHRVPSAVSYAVRKVEDSLGFPVFDRAERTARFTPQGRRILAEGRDVLAAAERLERLSSLLRTGWEPELHVVIDGALPMAPVLRSLRDFANPDIPTRLRLDVEYREGVVHRFRADEAHLMLLIGFDEDEDTSAWVLEPLPPLRMLLLASPAYDAPLAEGLELSIRDSRPGSESGRRSFSGARDVAWVTDFHAKRIALLEGVGFGWMPEHLVAEDLAAGRLAVPDSDGPTEWTYQPRIASREGQQLGKGAELFLSHLRG